MYVVGTKKNHLKEMVLLSTQNLCLNWAIGKYSKFHAKKLYVPGPQIRVRNWKLFSYFSTKTYVVGAQRNRLNDLLLLSTQNLCLNWVIRKYSQLHAKKLYVPGPQIRVRNWKLFSYFSTRTYAVGTQKNSLNETVPLSTKDTCLKWWIRK